MNCELCDKTAKLLLKCEGCQQFVCKDCRYSSKSIVSCSQCQLITATPIPVQVCAPKDCGKNYFLRAQELSGAETFIFDPDSRQSWEGLWKRHNFAIENVKLASRALAALNQT
jgi:hypothetical protein